MNNLQTVFDRVLAHLRQQGKPATTDNGKSCLYRTEDGCACAVGCLIPDELYSPLIEHRHISRLPDQIKAHLASLAGDGDPTMSWPTAALLSRLQSAHDAWANSLANGRDPIAAKSDWEDQMTRIASYFQLTCTPPTAEGGAA